MPRNRDAKQFNLQLKHPLNNIKKTFLLEYFRSLSADFPNAHNVYVKTRFLPSNAHNIDGGFRDLLYNVPSDLDALKKWVIMLCLDETRRVGDLVFNGPHPLATLKLWEIARRECDWETGQVKLSREELAAAAGIAPAQVSRSMTLLEGYGAIWRNRKGGAVTYYCSPHVGWYGPKSELQRVAAWMHDEMKRRHEQETEEPSLPMQAPAAE